ncbi:hypothetical protein GH714_041745 [Hevea brasiliensis]|uniref:DCD domain-containing protein n=1 Tax=Hevea brasiliensis TaxID=3981 RepID=A0A6A6MTA1_HEVBR|nr:hypothetical protein GH714_041745 [Hevea brasiliensis]
MTASKLAEQTRSKGERMNNLDLSKGLAEIRPRDKIGFQEDNKFEGLNFNMLNLESKMTENVGKNSFRNGVYNMNAVYQKNNINNIGNLTGSKYSGNSQNIKEPNNNNNNSNNNNENSANNAVDKRFNTLPATETLPQNEVLGGYIFVCNNDTMQEDLKRQLFGAFCSDLCVIHLPTFFIDNLSLVIAASFGGSNIDPTAWEDKKCKGESRKVCQALEENAFRPVLRHYDGPKFRLELPVPETLDEQALQLKQIAC